MRKRSAYRPKACRVPAFVEQSARWLRAREIARPMRQMFDLLATGEVLEVSGVAAMDMPEIDPSLRQSHTDLVEIAPAIHGWIDMWQTLAPDLGTYHLRILADRLDEWKPLTPRLVEQAREEFDACISRIPQMDGGRIKSAILSTQIRWELEKQQDRTA